MIVIVSGSIGRLPVGGHAWVDMQYLLGLRALGHDVYYLEECGNESWVYNWETQQMETELRLRFARPRSGAWATRNQVPVHRSSPPVDDTTCPVWGAAHEILSLLIWKEKNPALNPW